MCVRVCVCVCVCGCVSVSVGEGSAAAAGHQREVGLAVAERLEGQDGRDPLGYIAINTRTQTSVQTARTGGGSSAFAAAVVCQGWGRVRNGGASMSLSLSL